ncbi:MAG: L-histidine N(alpha)-methyltransferase [Nanoarchaeales archaeon]|nr:L-histidine N(alpha)-methyltransferase [Nanoarchaeales archaeon]
MKKHYIDKTQNYYKSQKQAQAYLDMFKSKEYSKRIVSGEFSLLQNNLKILLKYFSNQTHYIDLGPGNADKSELILNRAKSKNKIKTYTAIDIQKIYLEIAKEKIENLKIPVEILLTTFEDGLKELKKIQNNKFIYLGATHCNFKPEEINQTLIKNMNKEDFVYISTELFSENITDIIKNYNTLNSETMIKPVIEKFNINENDIEFVVEYNNELNQIELGYKLKTQTQQFNKGDFLICLTSRKPTATQFRESLESDFEGEFIQNKSNIAFIGKKINNNNKICSNKQKRNSRTHHEVNFASFKTSFSDFVNSGDFLWSDYSIAISVNQIKLLLVAQYGNFTQ